MGKNVAKLFDNLEKDIKSCDKERQKYNIDYEPLKKGNHVETRFVLGKIIMDTMRTKITCEPGDIITETKGPVLSKLFL